VTPASIVALAVAGARWWHTWPEHAAAGVALVVLAFLAVVAQVTDAIVVLTDEQRITSVERRSGAAVRGFSKRSDRPVGVGPARDAVRPRRCRADSRRGSRDRPLARRDDVPPA
jgi:hypothetical protein